MVRFDREGDLLSIVDWLLDGLESGIDWLEAHARWSELRGLGQSGLVRASVLMPAFGYILLLNDEAQRYLTTKLASSTAGETIPAWLLLVLPHLPSWIHDTYLWVHDHLPDLWRVWMLYYGTFCLAIGSISFSMFCPFAIKRYSSPYEMADVESKHRLEQSGDIRERVKVRLIEMSRWQAAILHNPNRVELNDTHPADVGRLLFYLWLIADASRPVLRIIILLIYSVGLTLLAIPAIYTFGQVTLRAIG
jgi:hypothetical protein